MKETSQQLIQERKTELREKTDLASFPLESLGVCAIIAADFDGNIIAYNEGTRRLFGYSPEDVIGKHGLEIFFPGGCIEDGQLKEITDCLMEKREFSRGVEMVKANGEFFPARVMFTLTRDQNGTAIGFFEIVEDLTGHKKMQQELIVIDRLASLGELVGGIAHEINNPLTGIIGFSDLLLGRKGITDDVREDLVVINREAKRAAEIVNNLLIFSRKSPSNSEAVNINILMEKTLALRTHQFKLSNIEVNTKFAPGLPEIIMNSSNLQQVFMNIIVNAEFFMIEAHKKGTLAVTTECAGNTVKVSFADDGPGISPENMRHIFDPFFTTKAIGKGTGLGLSISYGIISEAGGRIYAESQLGKGATFVLELLATPRTGETGDENS